MEELDEATIIASLSSVVTGLLQDDESQASAVSSLANLIDRAEGRRAHGCSHATDLVEELGRGAIVEAGCASLFNKARRCPGGHANHKAHASQLVEQCLHRVRAYASA